MGLGLFGTAAVRERAAAQASGWQPDPALIAELERRKVTWTYRESEVPSYRLPDPLQSADGSKITTRQQWERKRRPETLELFREHVYGRSPTKPRVAAFEVTATDPRAMDGKATLKLVKITSAGDGKSFSFEAAVLVPNGRTGRVPAFLLINNRAVS